VRSGNSFSGFYSRDGVNWTQQGPTVTVPMAGNVFVGLALTAHNNGALNTSTFDNVAVTGAAGPLPPPVARLTRGEQFGAAGRIFTASRVGITDFTTTFTFQITPGTSPMADGMAFVIQSNSPTALGPAGGGLGYGLDHPDPSFRGIRNSIAVKFDIFNNSGEGVNSTGLFTDGRSPTVREGGLAASVPDRTVSLDGTGIDLNSGRVFRVTLAYDGTALTE